MASGRDDLADRLDDVEATVESLLDEHAVARSRLRDLEAVVGSEEPAERSQSVGGGTAERERSAGERATAFDRSRPAPADGATQAEVERAVQEVELEEGEEEEERDGEFIVA